MDSPPLSFPTWILIKYVDAMSEMYFLSTFSVFLRLFLPSKFPFVIVFYLPPFHLCL